MQTETLTQPEAMTEAEREQYAALTRPYLQEELDKVRASMDTDQLLDTPETLEDAGVGVAYISHAVFYGIAEGKFTAVGAGISLYFKGEHWGPGIGVGASAGAIVYFVPPREVVGKVEYVITQANPGGLAISCRRNGKLLCAFEGPAIGIGVTVAKGTGTWTIA